MRNSSVYGIISDIHANEEALRAVLACGREKGVEEFVCLGDVIGYGAAVNECVELIRENCSVVVQGNHDADLLPPRNQRIVEEAQISLDYAYRTLTAENAEWVSSLKHPVDVPQGKFLAVHGSLEHRDNYIFTHKDVLNNFRLFKENFPLDKIMFFGHSHLPMVLGENKAVTQVKEDTSFTLGENMLYLVNPGSVGQPRDKVPKASFAIYYPQENTLNIHRVEYDIQKEQERILAAGLPERNARRIGAGI